MKQLRLVQNLMRLLVALLVVVMLFIPWFSVRVNTLTEERAAQIAAMGLIAMDRGDMTEEEFMDLMEQIAPVSKEAGMIYMGKTKDGEDLPFDFIVDSKRPGLLEDCKYVEDLADKVYPVQSEIGDAEDKVEVSFSVFTAIKTLVSGGGFTFRLITTNILEEGELENTDDLSSEDIARISAEIEANREESGFSDVLISNLRGYGVKNSETWVALSKLDTSKLDEDVMNLVWLASSFSSFTVIATLLLLVIIPLTLVVVVLSELLKLLRHRFDEQGVKEGSTLFQYCTPCGMILALAFLDKGFDISPLVFVPVGLIFACAVFYSFTEGKAKQGKGCVVFHWGVRAVSLLCVVACVIAFVMGMGINVFETAVNEDTYEEGVEKMTERHEKEMKRLNEQLMRLKEEHGAGQDNSEIIDSVEKDIEVLSARIQYESVDYVLVKMQILKLLILLYLIMVASYFAAVVDRLGSMRSLEFPQVLLVTKYVGRIVCVAFAAAVEILVFGGLVTPFVWFFAAFAVLEIALAIFKKVARRFEYNYVLRKGQELCSASVIPVDSWDAAAEQLNRLGEHATSLKTVAVVDAIDVLLEEYQVGEQSIEELGEQLRSAFAVDAEAKKKKGERKRSRRR